MKHAFRYRSFGGSSLFLALAFVLAGLPFQIAHGSEADTAQKLLFDNPYLTALKPPAELAYRFEHSTVDETAYGKTFTDQILIGIGPPSGKYTLNTVSLDIFTESRNRKLGPMSDVRGNPIIMVFLERDMFQMKRRVQGAPSVFRNIIRRAMRDNADIEDVEIRFGDAEHAAKRITIMPFEGDHNPPQFGEIGKKSYQFTVSNAVPGGIYEIVSRLPNLENPAEELVVDRIIFIGGSGN